MIAARFDLDDLEAFYSRVDTNRGRRVVAVVTELRAAREVVEAATHLNDSFGWHTEDPGTERRARELDAALHAYGKAVGQP
jgi:hypothetical protein